MTERTSYCARNNSVITQESKHCRILTILRHFRYIFQVITRYSAVYYAPGITPSFRLKRSTLVKGDLDFYIISTLTLKPNSESKNVYLYRVFRGFFFSNLCACYFNTYSKMSFAAILK